MFSAYTRSLERPPLVRRFPWNNRFTTQSDRGYNKVHWWWLFAFRGLPLTPGRPRNPRCCAQNPFRRLLAQYTYIYMDVCKYARTRIARRARSGVLIKNKQCTARDRPALAAAPSPASCLLMAVRVLPWSTQQNITISNSSHPARDSERVYLWKGFAGRICSDCYLDDPVGGLTLQQQQQQCFNHEHYSGVYKYEWTNNIVNKTCAGLEIRHHHGLQVYALR